MAYVVSTTRRFDKCIEKMKKRGCPMDELRRVIVLLMETGVLPVKYKPHKLTGNHKGQWECYIKPDWLLVWEQNDNEFTLLLLETGTHSDLF